MRPTRNVTFLELTARRMPNRDVCYGPVVVCWGASLTRGYVFTYSEKFHGGASRSISRDEAERMLAEYQANKKD